MTTYADFLAQKRHEAPACGFDPGPISPHAFPFQRDLIRWACRRGRAALFAATGMGKTLMELEYGRLVAGHAGGPVLLLAPLAVAQQTAREAQHFGIPARLVERPEDIGSGVNITNYHKVERFESVDFSGLVADESSIVKDHEGFFRNYLIERFAATPYRLCATATPCPNDYMELGNTSELIGAMTRAEMLAMFFCHDGGQTNFWRLKGHAEGVFWNWLCSWAALVRMPSDLGYPDDGYILPPLTVHSTEVEGIPSPGWLVPVVAQTLSERREARQATVDQRVAAAAAIVNSEPDEAWLVWCDLNRESEALTRAIPGAVEVRGSQPHEEKEARILAFQRGDSRVLVTKPSLAGMGLNLQRCARVVFVGLSDSWEQYYQAVRRCWRFGQTRPVECYVVSATTEGAVVSNIQRKERDAERMAREMSQRTRAIVQENVRGLTRTQTAYIPAVDMALPDWVEAA